MKATSKPKSTSKPKAKRAARSPSPSAPPAAATTFIVPPSLATQLQEKGLHEEALRLLFDDRLADTKFLRYLQSHGIITTKAVLPAFRSDHRFLWAAGRALRLQSELQARYGLTPAQALRLILSQRLIEGASEGSAEQRDLLQTAAHLLREDQMHRTLDQKDEAIQLQRRRIETLEAKVQEAASLTENAEISEEDRISQIRAIFGR